MENAGTIYGINGPIVYIKGITCLKMAEMVYVCHEKLVGEVIGLTKDKATIQVYEETTGLKIGEPVISSGAPISVTLAPGILHNQIFLHNHQELLWWAFRQTYFLSTKKEL